MKRKIYFEPTIQIVKLEQTKMLMTSGDLPDYLKNTDSWGI